MRGGIGWWLRGGCELEGGGKGPPLAAEGAPGPGLRGAFGLGLRGALAAAAAPGIIGWGRRAGFPACIILLQVEREVGGSGEARRGEAEARPSGEEGGRAGVDELGSSLLHLRLLPLGVVVRRDDATRRGGRG
mmetsp:Transcript_6923/g.16966  ORF Transcript_6923/g.16966 Transcript_6923/m.16966 type:complete len:133 (+) Transcript_6923:121-519(+)